ncbi:YycH family regulatory protein [Ectobacillus sp. sgz5001026]|jgi:regulatory protein YycH of two-component signal transduction system YycFG|uniref:YycH family regulatory protein n=1 Tax=Ectobacillus sp. sgz5001026 TaxID=3242473 RepID=UPI0036D2B9D1
MNTETFKTTILINLVVISLFLTYSLWTIKPPLNAVQSQKYIQDVPTMTKKEIANLIAPYRILYHKENTHIATEQSAYVNAMYNALEKGEFQDFKDISTKVDKNAFLSFVHGKDKLEIVFPTEIPFDTIKKVQTIKEKNVSDYSFDRIVISFQGMHDDDIKTYFVSYDTQKIYEMTLKNISVKDLENLRDQYVLKSGIEYTEYATNENHAIFLPKENVEMPRMLYVTSKLQEDVFRDSLFNDTRYVKKDTSEIEDSYTDGTRLMRISKGTQMLTYMNPSITNTIYDDGTLVQKSIDYTNNHGGWSDTYHFYSMNAREGKTTFRLYADNSYPVFSSSGMATLQQVWGNEEPSLYNRPLFKLSFRGEYEKTELPSGTSVISLLEKMKDANMNQITNIQIGYEMNPESNTNNVQVSAVRLEPIWIISYGNTYKKLDWNQNNGGGALVGLEQN